MTPDRCSNFEPFANRAVVRRTLVVAFLKLFLTSPCSRLFRIMPKSLSSLDSFCSSFSSISFLYRVDLFFCCLLYRLRDVLSPPPASYSLSPCHRRNSAFDFLLKGQSLIYRPDIRSGNRAGIDGLSYRRSIVQVDRTNGLRPLS